MHGRYTIQRSLGKGGMGALYLANETIANRQRLVVIKEMLDYFDPNDPNERARAQKRFETEADTLGTLSVSGVPQVFEYFSENGRNYIVMQFIEGKNLEIGLTHYDENDDLVHGKPYPVEQVRKWSAKLCKILESLAAKDIVHMDIKPANLILDAVGEIWLVDFGTVKAHAFGLPIGLPGSPAGAQRLAQKSSIYGTIGYAAPEQTAGKAEQRSDVYALAATLYHLLTDDDPGQQPDVFPKMNQLPADIVQALRAALAKDVNQRVRAAEFGLLLEARPPSGLSFFWKDGSVSREPRCLAATADRLWAEALTYFNGDAWEKWFKDWHRYDLADRMQTIKAGQPNPDLALDAFLRVLDTSFPPPRLETSAPALDVGVLPWQAQRVIDLKVSNRGSACLQARFVNLPPALQVAPLEFAAHGERVVKIKVDASSLSPAAHPHRLLLNIEAGLGGQVQLPISLTIPEPVLDIEAPGFDYGPTYRGDDATFTFLVSNPGDSPFLGEARGDAGRVQVRPGRFFCSPGASSKLTVQIDTRDMPAGQYASEVNIWARAGQWEQTAPVQVSWQVSWLKTFIKYGAPPLGWGLMWTAYGGFWGFLLGAVCGALGVRMAETSTAMLVGALLGAVICVVPVAAISGLGGAGEVRGWESARKGAAPGALVGGVVGTLAGALVFQFLTWLNLGLGQGEGLDIFGALVGALAGIILGGGLWLMPKE